MLQQSGGPKFDPTTLTPDKVSLELEIGPSVLLVYGSWIRGFVNLKVILKHAYVIKKGMKL